MGHDQSKNSPTSECPVRKFRSIDHTVPRKVTTCSVADLSDFEHTRSRRSNSTPNENDMSRSVSPGARRRRRSSASHFMSRRDRILVVNSWKRCRKAGPDHIGTKIFMNLLTANPDIKETFDLEKIPDGRLKYEPHFRQHSIVYTKTFDYIINNIEYPDKLEAYFINMGRRHVAYQKRGFSIDFWNIFTDCMTGAISDPGKPATMEAWRTLITVIIGFMRKGFDEENSKRR